MADRKYLVYKITNRFNGKIYIGCHSTLNKNDRYMGSGTEIKEAIKNEGRKSFVKEILFEFDNKEEMLLKEKESVTREFCMRIDTYNRIEGGGTYLTLDMVSVRDQEGHTSRVYRNDPRYLSGELVGVTKGKSFEGQSLANKGKVNVKDKDGNTLRVSLDDPRYLSDELVHVAKGLPQHPNQSWEGKQHTDDTKERMSEKASERVVEKNSMFGRERTEEFKMKMKENFSNKFLVYDLDGNFISEEFNVRDFAERNNLNRSTVNKAIRGDYKKAGNFQFKKSA